MIGVVVWFPIPPRGADVRGPPPRGERVSARPFLSSGREAPPEGRERLPAHSSRAPSRREEPLIHAVHKGGQGSVVFKSVQR